MSISQSEREERLADVILDYLEAAQAGQEPDRKQFLAAHPEFAADLEEFLDNRDRVERAAGPIRQLAAATGSRAGRGRNRTHAPGPMHATHAVVAADSNPVPTGVPFLSELGELGDYRLIREIGRGGMGIVYEAQQISLNRRVALKVLPLAAALDPKHLQRFKNEARAAAQLHHSNIVPVYAVGEERHVHYYAMQLIEGQSVAAIIAELQKVAAPDAASDPRDPTPPSDLANQLAAGQAVTPRPESDAEPTAPYGLRLVDGKPGAETAPHAAGSTASERSIKSQRFFQRVAHIGIKAAEALEHAHQVGVVHRDIKPANLLLDTRGNVWVTDFGLALFKSDSGLTMTGELLGTLRYMSPEQTFAKRGLVDHRTDIYSLGATLYELATLEQLFAGEDRQELLHQIAYEEPRSPRSINGAIPVELETIILKALAKNPAERYATAQDLADDLQRFLQDKPILAKRPTFADKLLKWSRRHRPTVVAAGILLVVATLGLTAGLCVIAREHATTLEKMREAEKEAKRAEEQTKLAEEQRDRAEKNFELARSAVDLFTRVARDELKRPEDVERVRTTLLQAAQRYYRGFVDQHPDDPTLMDALVTSEANLAGIHVDLDEPAAALMCATKAQEYVKKWAHINPASITCQIELADMQRSLLKYQGCAKLAELTEPRIQKELGLREEQLKLITRQNEKLAEHQRRVAKSLAKLSVSEQLKQIVEIGAKTERVIEESLNAGQAKRLTQIALQRRGAEAFHDPEIVRKLKLTREQQEKIAKIRATPAELVYFRLDKLGNHAGAWQGGADIRKMVSDMHKKTLDRILTELSEDQRSTWRELTGEPFDG